MVQFADWWGLLDLDSDGGEKDGGDQQRWSPFNTPSKQTCYGFFVLLDQEVVERDRRDKKAGS